MNRNTAIGLAAAGGVLTLAGTLYFGLPFVGSEEERIIPLTGEVVSVDYLKGDEDVAAAAADTGSGIDTSDIAQAQYLDVVVKDCRGGDTHGDLYSARVDLSSPGERQLWNGLIQPGDYLAFPQGVGEEENPLLSLEGVLVHTRRPSDCYTPKTP